MYKYRFDIIWQSKHMKAVSDFLQKCDLGTGQIGIKESFEFRSEKDM